MNPQSTRQVPRVYKRTNCRLCLGSNIRLLFALTPTPPAEWYFAGEERKVAAVSFPLDLYFCEDCKHVQLLDVLDPVDLFTNYFYESNTSPGLVDHFEDYAKVVSEKCRLPAGALVIDIGSNDGTLLKHFESLGYRVAGIEPSKNLSDMCNRQGIKTYNSFLNSKVVPDVLKDNGCAKLVTANNVFAHNDDLHGMAECINLMLVEGGVFVFEVSSILHTMKGLVFDYIYHEHLSYHSLVSLMPFLEKFSLQIFDVEFVSTKGGSYRVFAMKSSIPIDKSERLMEALENEISCGLANADFYIEMYQAVVRQKQSLHQYLGSLPKDSVIAGYGASATSTTLTYEFKLIDAISYLVDDNPIRHDKYLPGTNIKVYPPDQLEIKTPTHIIVLAWRFSQMILGKLFKTLPTSVIYIVPLPEFKIIRVGE